MVSAWSGIKLQDFISAAVERHLAEAEAAMEQKASTRKQAQ
jgi:hypothetical protein